MSKIAIIAPEIFDGETILHGFAVLIDGEYILGLVPFDEIPLEFELQRFNSGILSPGFIDWQVNGGGGVLFNNDTTAAGIARIVDGHLTGGTTSLLPTLISDTQQVQHRAVAAVQDFLISGEKGVLGLHLEGPFFAMEKRGTHAEEHIRQISNEDIAWLCSHKDLKLLVTLAPEMTEVGQIKSLVDAGIIVSAGHSNGTYSDAQRAIKEGLSGFTHLYNAMSPASGREPGVVGAALLSKNAWCGIIADGHHVHPDMVRLASDCLPRGKLCLVTDAMATVGSDSNSFEIYGETITEKDGCLINAQGRLAGSAIGMIEAVHICHTVAGIALEECLRMASLYPAQFLDLDQQLGRLKTGYRADIVHFCNDFQVTQTWVAGQAKL